MFELDQAHEKLNVFDSQMVRDIWYNKYRWKDESAPNDTFDRVASAIFADDGYHRELCYELLCANLWLPGGRIIAGAGTGKRVTFNNCYVNGTIDDSMEGIMHAHATAAFTLQQGGGIGTDFSTIRPEGALLTRTHTKASGPIPFMHMWDSMSRTIRSAGDRRGAMMGTISDTHPDLLKFVTAKRTPGSLEQFNISVLVSDAFMGAVREDEEWLLHFSIPPMERDPALAEYDFYDDETDRQQYVYSIHRARDLWDIITRNTYEYSEPGVIFIDRINELNNLYYCETIRCTNPCGEQPLGPHNVCNLGHINLARVVKHPFSHNADVNFDLIKLITKMGVKFLDNIVDLTLYPVPEQAEAQKANRRLGLGFTGLADMLSQMQIRYGSPAAVRLTEEVCRTICYAAYEASIELAKLRGPFPAYNEAYINGTSFAGLALPNYIREQIASHGIRNSHLLTVAPTGTTSILAGNVSSGCEPVFLHQTQRKVLKPSNGFADEWETYTEWGYGAKLYRSLHPNNPDLPNYMVTTDDLTVEDHVVMQAAAQRWIDSSVSKTVNIPKEYPYDSFVKVYDLAYSLGCKGCTTYRPSDVRGSVLSAPGSASSTINTNANADTLEPRPELLQGHTYKIRWPSLNSALYLTINEQDGRPYEIFIASKDARWHDWWTALTIIITSIFRKGGDVSYVGRELQQVQALNDSTFKDGRNHPSLVAYLGYIIEQHINRNNNNNSPPQTPKPQSLSSAATSANNSTAPGSTCPECRNKTLIREEGCKSCLTCGYTTCG